MSRYIVTEVTESGVKHLKETCSIEQLLDENLNTPDVDGNVITYNKIVKLGNNSYKLMFFNKLDVEVVRYYLEENSSIIQEP